MRFDKKNSHGKVQFVLLERVGTPKIDCEVSLDEIVEAFAYYAN